MTDDVPEWSSPRYDDEAFLAALRAVDGWAFTGEVAETVGCSTHTVVRRLDDLAEAGAVNKRLAGPVYLWELADTGGHGEASEASEDTDRAD